MFEILGNNDQGRVLRRMWWRDHSWLVCLIIGLLCGVLATSIAAHTFYKKSQTENAAEITALKEKHHHEMSDKDVDIEEQKRLVEAANAATTLAKEEARKAEEEKQAALARLDADKDGVEIPADLCPNSDPKGGATAVNSKGCLAIEIAMSCDATPFHPYDSKEKWIFSEGCEFSDDPKMSYSCIADTSKGTWDLQGCDEFDPKEGG